MMLTVLGDRIFVRPENQPDQTDSGLHIVYDRQISTMRGEVIAVGEGPRSKKGKLLPHIVDKGDRVIFSPDSGSEVQFERETLICMFEDDVLAVID